MYGCGGNRGYTRYVCASRYGTNRAACPGGIPQVPAPTLDAWVWERVLVALNADVVADAMLERSGGEGDGEGLGGDEALDSLHARRDAYDAHLERLTRHYRNKRRQQANALDNRGVRHAARRDRWTG